MFERILVCLDGSKLAEQILPYAAEQALRFNSKLMLLQVMSLPSGFSMASATGTSAGLGDIMEREVQRQEAEIRAYFNSLPTVRRAERGGEGVSISNLINAAHKRKRKVGFCGQATSDHPEFTAFLVKAGLILFLLIQTVCCRL